MRKYVRTEDKIIDVTYWEKDDKGNYYTWESDDFLAKRIYIYKEDIIKEADYIESLIDDMFVIYKSNGKVILRVQNHNRRNTEGALERAMKSSVKFDQVEIVGGIWNNEGFTILASNKNNNELELI